MSFILAFQFRSTTKSRTFPDVLIDTIRVAMVFVSLASYLSVAYHDTLCLCHTPTPDANVNCLFSLLEPVTNFSAHLVYLHQRIKCTVDKYNSWAAQFVLRGLSRTNALSSLQTYAFAPHQNIVPSNFRFLDATKPVF